MKARLARCLFVLWLMGLWMTAMAADEGPAPAGSPSPSPTARSARGGRSSRTPASQTASASSSRPASRASRSRAGQAEEKSVAEAGTPLPTTVYSKGNAPATLKREDLPLKESVSQYGITWTFDKPARVGQFVNGDWYVVGPVTIQMIDPQPLFGKEVSADEALSRELEKIGADKLARNGSLLDPTVKREVSFDSWVKNYYRPELFARRPISMKPGDCLVSSISIKKGQRETVGTYGSYAVRGDGDKSRPIVTEAILTCLAGPQPPDAFRPAYCDRTQKIYLARDLKRELLPKLPRMPSATADALAKSWRSFQRPWFNTCFFSYEQAAGNMPNYGQQMAQAGSDAGCLLCLDFKPIEKEPILVGLVQVGIDYYGQLRAGSPGWEGFGGHGSGRKFPIVFAGLLLGDDEMAHVNKTFPKAAFGEDEQTAYGDCWTGAKVVFAGHSGIAAATGLTKEGTAGHMGLGPYEHNPPSKWTYGNFMSDGYRRSNTTRAWVGFALVIHLMKAESAWGHDAFFDYVDRWVAEAPRSDEFTKEMAPYCPYKPGSAAADVNRWSKVGTIDGAVVKEMWPKYRPTCAAPQDGWKQKHDDSYYTNAVKDMDKKIEAEKKDPSVDQKPLKTKAEMGTTDAPTGEGG